MKTGPWTHASYSKNGEKAIQCGFRLAKQQVCTTYLTFSLPSLHDYHVKLFHVLWMTQYKDFLFLFVWTIGCPTNLSLRSFSCISLKNISKFSISFPRFSPTRPTERERERDPGKRWSRGSRTKLILRERSFVSHFFCLVYSQRSRSDRKSKIELLTLLQL